MFVVVLALGSSAWWTKLGGALAACGAPVLAVQWGRSGGLKKQKQLFASWGGAPTLSLLRYRTGGDPATVSERHQVVQRATGVELPSQAQETAKPDEADATYESSMTKLRVLTDSEKEFRLLLKENINYGFRRNLWGRKLYGIGVAILVALVGIGLLLADVAGHRLVPWASAAVAVAFALVAMIVWVSMVTADWVREAADTYATQLFASAMKLPAAKADS